MAHADLAGESGCLVPASIREVESRVRRSRFIATAAPATSRERALAAVDDARTRFPDARHHCWAYLVGDPAAASGAASSDDGEPSGTAGRPILGVIEHKRIGDVVVVVSRYFGGIKLGAGGLVRAYAGAAEQVLSAVTLERHETRSRCLLTGGFADEQPLRHWLSGGSGELLDIIYGEGVTARIECRSRDLPALREFCAARGLWLKADGAP